MNSDNGAPAPRETDPGEIRRIFELQRKAFLKNPYPTWAEREAALDTLSRLVKENAHRFVAAISADFGTRSPFETQMLEIFSVLEDIRHARRHLRRWMRPKRRWVSIWFQPAGARVIRQPLGVVGIITPWNFPLLLSVAPLVAALAAGNRVILKMSEDTPATDALMAELIGAAFPLDLVAVVSGGPAAARAMTATPFDRIMYTGSTARARDVLLLAAANLTPVTLELGGKNPAIIHPDFPLDTAAERIMTAKLLNAGQSCVSADYVMVKEGMEEEFIKAASAHALKKYPAMAANQDYTAIINERHYRRVAGYIEDARAKGARIVEVVPPGEIFDPARRKIPPTFVLGMNDTMAIAHEEIFGPVMMVIPYKDLDGAMEYVNSRPRPLALYYFDHDSSRVAKVLRGTVSGGAAINDAVWQFSVHGLPFGGVGHSGMGRYHGEYGFNEFSHEKGVFLQSGLNQLWTVKPPYGWISRLMLRLMIR
jgi:acyl-CoA reductase-like NAD-dependent aldehyde dehydrogenase